MFLSFSKTHKPDDSNKTTIPVWGDCSESGKTGVKYKGKRTQRRQTHAFTNLVTQSEPRGNHCSYPMCLCRLCREEVSLAPRSEEILTGYGVSGSAGASL